MILQVECSKIEENWGFNTQTVSFASSTEGDRFQHDVTLTVQKKQNPFMIGQTYELEIREKS